jgi:hypothetical protein
MSSVTLGYMIGKDLGPVGSLVVSIVMFLVLCVIVKRSNNK